MQDQQRYTQAAALAYEPLVVAPAKYGSAGWGICQPLYLERRQLRNLSQILGSPEAKRIQHLPPLFSVRKCRSQLPPRLLGAARARASVALQMATKKKRSQLVGGDRLGPHAGVGVPGNNQMLTEKMHTITATRQTWLKRSPAQSSELSDDQKKLAEAGTKLAVSDYKLIPGGHWEVVIDGETWFIFDAAVHGPASHWDCSWEQDTKEADAPVARAITATVNNSRIPVGLGLHVGDSFDTLITPHFTYGELCNYSEERRFTSADSVVAAHDLLMFLEKVRAHFKAPVKITSGHRPPAVNRRIGGASVSEHLYRAKGIGAVDFYVDGVDIYAVQSYCDRDWPHSVGYGAARGFVHLGIGRGRVRWDY